MSHETLFGGVSTDKRRCKKNEGSVNKCTKCDEYRTKYIKYCAQSMTLMAVVIGLSLLVAAAVVLEVITTTNYSNIRNDVQTLSQQCESAIDAVVAGTGDSGESLITLRDSIGAIKNKYSIE